MILKVKLMKKNALFTQITIFFLIGLTMTALLSGTIMKRIADKNVLRERDALSSGILADVERSMKGMLEPIYEERVIAHAEIRQIFKASGVGNIAGSYVLDGTIERGCSVRISREGEQIFEGALASLKRFKDDVKEVNAGYECGLVFDGFNDIAELDQVECYKMVEVPR